MSKHLWHGTWQGSQPEGDTHQRARTIVRPTGGIVRGKFPSRKNGRMVHHEGLLELDAIYLFETSPLIVRYREQPTTLQYPDGARLRRYTPDFELLLITGEIILVEIKPYNRLSRAEVRHTFDCVEEHMRRSLFPFEIFTELTIRQEPRLKNLKWLYHRAARIPPTREALTVALSENNAAFPVSIHGACDLLAVRGIDPYSCLLAGHLTCNLDIPLTANTLLTWNMEMHHDWFYISEEYGF